MSSSLSLPDSLLPASSSALAPLAEPIDYEEFLRLQLVPGMAALLSTQHIGRVLTIPVGQIAPMPHLPAWVMGVYNCRGEILWMVDLGHLCGLTPWHQQPIAKSQHTAVVLQIRDQSATSARNKYQSLGLVVSATEKIEQCDAEMLRTVQSIPIASEIEPFLRGYWWKANDDILAILDGEAILAAMPKA